MSFIVAHQGALVQFETREDADKRADVFRTEHTVEIWEIRKVAVCFPTGPKAPTPRPPGTPVSAPAAKAA